MTEKEREQTELLTRTKQTLAKLNLNHIDNKDPAIERQRQQLVNLLAQIEKRIQRERQASQTLCQPKHPRGLICTLLRCDASKN
jgi:hypothetical protein